MSRFFVYNCAIFIAPSFAVDPPETLRCILDKLAGTIETNFWINLLIGSVWKVVVTCWTVKSSQKR